MTGNLLYQPRRAPVPVHPRGLRAGQRRAAGLRRRAQVRAHARAARRCARGAGRRHRPVRSRCSTPLASRELTRAAHDAGQGLAARSEAARRRRQHLRVRSALPRAHPSERRVGKLTSAERSGCSSHCDACCAKPYDHRGSSVDDYVDAGGKEGGISEAVERLWSCRYAMPALSARRSVVSCLRNGARFSARSASASQTSRPTHPDNLAKQR